MESTNSWVMIDKEKFVAELKKRDLSMTAVSLEMGFNINYVVKQKEQSRLRRNVVNYLKSVYNLNPEAYQPEIKEATPEQAKPEVKEAVEVIDYDKLANVIYHAVKKALSGD